MTGTRYIILFCITCLSAWPSFAEISLNDSLRHALTSTSDAEKRIELLINLKDLNEDKSQNVLYSSRLFEEARKANDIYAMSVGANSYILWMANYPEKQDSIRYYITTFHSAAKGTPHEGHAHFWSMYIYYRKIVSESDKQAQQALYTDIIKQIEADKNENQYQRAGRLFLEGVIEEFQNSTAPNQTKRTQLWREAWDISLGMPDQVSKLYLSMIYHHLSNRYRQLHGYTHMIDLANRYISSLDQHYNSELIKSRRKLLYKDNGYVLCYKQLLYASTKVSEEDTYKYFDRIRNHMMSAKGANLKRNKVLFYEISYGLMDQLGHIDQSIAYCDSLLSIAEGRSAIAAQKGMARLLRKAGKMDQACVAYAKTIRISDSIKTAEYNKRLDQIRLNNDFEKLKLEETELRVAYRRMLIILSVCILIIMIIAAIRYSRVLKRTRKLQASIMRHTQKSGESERMKSVFINLLCKEIHTPFDAINKAVESLTSHSMPPDENKAYHKSIAENTNDLTQILEGLLEAAELTTLSSGLPLKKTDIAKICQKEIADAAINPKISYKIENCQNSCIVDTHPKYFALVLRSLLNNANKFTTEGEISICGHKETQNNKLQIIISDTGCGIPTDKMEHVFEYFTQLGGSSLGNGLGLPICRLIARRLQGELSIDRQYTAGARLIFTIPIIYDNE